MRNTKNGKIDKLTENINSSNFLKEMVNLVDEYADVKFRHTEHKENRENSIKLVKAYKPNKRKDKRLKLKKKLTDEVPICQRSSRFPFMEQKITENHVQLCLKDGIIAQSFSN